MKKFLTYVGIFSLSLILLAGGIEYMLHQVPNNFKFKKGLIESKSQEIQTLIIGSSVVNCSLNPSYMEKGTYNLAISGEWIRFNKLFLEQHIQSMPNLKTIIWGQCYHSLWIDDAQEFSEKDLIDHKLYMDIKQENDPTYSSELLSLRALALRKWSKHYIQHRRTMHCDSLGLDHSYDSEFRDNRWIEEIESMVKHQTQYMLTDENNLYLQNLDRINDVAKLCQKRKINLILVVPPVYEAFHKAANSTQMKKMDEGFNSIADQWNNVYFFNYLKDDRFTADDFYDGNHLSADKGAEKFSKLLYNDILSSLGEN